jgi:ABC-type uncharacterized transport system auxiliary subunit
VLFFSVEGNAMLRQTLTALMVVCSLLLCACAGVSRLTGTITGMDGGDIIRISVEPQPQPTLYRSGQAIRLSLPDPVDLRPLQNPRRIGHIRATVSDMHSSELILDQSASVLLAGALRSQMLADGFSIAGPGQAADFELATKVKLFELNIAGRDELSLVLEASLRDARSSEVIWSAIITEKSDRFAGVMGNSRETITRYLGTGFANLLQKLNAGVRGSLLLSYPTTISTSGAAALAMTLPGVTTLKSAAVREGAPAPSVPVPKVPALAPVKPAVIVPVEAGGAGVRPAELLHPAKGYGYFSVISMPTRVKVYSDDIYYGLTPLKVMVPAGVMVFEFRFDGYKTAREKVSVRVGETTELELKLSR